MINRHKPINFASLWTILNQLSFYTVIVWSPWPFPRCQMCTFIYEILFLWGLGYCVYNTVTQRKWQSNAKILIKESELFQSIVVLYCDCLKVIIPLATFTSLICTFIFGILFRRICGLGYFIYDILTQRKWHNKRKKITLFESSCPFG